MKKSLGILKFTAEWLFIAVVAACITSGCITMVVTDNVKIDHASLTIDYDQAVSADVGEPGKLLELLP